MSNQNVKPVDFLTPSDWDPSSVQRSLLLYNLQHYGWSPISILVSNKNKKKAHHDDHGSTNESWILPPTKDAILELMQSHRQDGSKKNNDRFTFRTAESGAKGGTSVEPKESLELKRSDVVLSDDESSTTKADQWCWAMSEIARSVSDLLELPKNTFSVKNNEDDDESSNKDDEKKDDGQQNDDGDNNCLDLLRIFSYHATPAGPQLGSSPHTDWGSWTIVWQDDVGGLETHNRETQQWEAVPTPKTTSNYSFGPNAKAIWHCIVHVGDMSSLALQKKESSSTTSITETNRDASTTKDNYWPSPEHRVVTSTTQKRGSLVYFGYPPANTSIYTIRQRLKDWKPSCRGSSPLPLTEYYLLQNQSSSSSSSAEVEPGAVERQLQEYYNKLEKFSIREVIQEKWNQVQRSNY